MHHRTVLSVFPLFFLILCVVTYGGEREALLEFKASVSDPAGVLSDWGAAAGHCSWRGVYCDARGRVVAVNISSDTGGQPAACTRSFPFVRRCHGEGRGLAGKLSPSIGKLSNLRVLSLPFHSFYGEIPVQVWGIEKLEVFDLEGNLLVGTLPSRFPRQLRVLNLASNLITGEIPFSLSRCVHLEVLDLSRNRLCGSLPSFLDNFRKLNKLLLSSNHLENSIPDDICGACSTLEHLDLSGNSLIGIIPRSLGNCSNLRSLLLFSNLLHGVIPSDLGHLKMLRALDVSRNNLRGQFLKSLATARN
ncbi:hypothetical protein HPP92_000903 [Vanilla planifolia]|uniref:Leucine-rich repeat-containing N-terminal plant-type domain-containing protein n=1 Tax=Vanilla planifolia TaxID=51239 RepID=A0A835S2B9_VANPL|nr:hypothetical protein HPP92_000903 [Vanilla planifolia]